MTITVGELTKNGDLNIVGNINTRLPVITNGLIAHFPFDNSTKAITDKNQIDYSTWIVGSSGSQIGFSQNGETSCNSIIEDVDPFGATIPVWRTLNNDVTSDADGGWNSSAFPIDNTKTYRYSVWVKRDVLGDGTFYLGCYGYGSANGVISNTDGITVNTNPYFTSRAWGTLPIGEWILVVGHVFKSDYAITGLHAESGYYNRFGDKIASAGTDFRWQTVTTTATHRTYLYYSTLPSTSQSWCHPRVDVCGGGEPTIQDLINGFNGSGGTINPITNTNTTITDNGIAVEEATTNLITNGDCKTYPLLNGNVYGGFGGNNIVTEFNRFHNKQAMKIMSDSLTTSTDCFYQFGNWSMNGLSMGTTYTLSMDIYCPVDIDLNITCFGIWHYNGVSWTAERLYLSNITDFKKGQWNRVYTTTIIPSTGIVNIMGRIELRYDLNNAGKCIYVSNIQWENKAFATSFVNGSRGNPVLNYPISNIESFTVNAWVIPKEPIPFTVYRKNMLITFDYINGYTIGDSISLFIRGNVTGNPCLAFWVSNPATWYNSNVSVPTNELSMVTYRYNYITKIMDIFLNGELVYTQTGINKKINPIANISGHGSDEYPNSIIKDLSIYNRVLSNTEILELANPTYEFTTKGDLIAPQISIKPNIPNDATYFPLGVNTRSKDYNIRPYKNLCAYPAFNAGWGLSPSATATTVADTIDGYAVTAYQVSYTGSGDGYTNYPFTIEPNKTYTVSFWIKASVAGVSMYDGCKLQEWGGSWRAFTNYISGSYYPTIPTTWTKVTLSGTSYIDTYTTASLVFRTPNATGVSILYALPVIECESYEPPTAVFENGVCWSGQATTNILSLPTSTYSAWGTNIGTSIYFKGNNGGQGVALNITSFTDGGVRWYDTGSQKVASASTTYTVSATIKFEGSGYPSVNLFYLRQYNSVGAQLSEGGLYNSLNMISLGNGWYKAYATFTTNALCTTLLIEGYEYKSFKIWMYDIQCEQKLFFTPFVNGTRPTTEIHYNPKLINCATNFTIFGWYNLSYFDDTKYEGILCHDDGSINRFLIMGNTSENKVRVWWGDSTTGTSLTTSAPTFVVGQWCMFAVRRNGSVVNVWDSRNNILYKSTDNTSGALFDGMTYKNNWTLGNWGSAWALNGFLKDFGFVQRAMSDEEVDKMFKDKMQNLDNEVLQIQNSINTGQVI